jgi:NAD(P)-dependent dehydrogenase (short-subunit alcohol dehydrogenase family)
VATTLTCDAGTHSELNPPPRPRGAEGAAPAKPGPRPHSRRVLITGGSSGIGEAMVERFVGQGDQVWFTYCSGADRAEQILDGLREKGHSGVHALAFSQGDWDSHQELMERLAGPVDVLVNNAAVGSSTVQRYSPGPDHLRDAAFFQINSVGPLWLVRQLLPGMIERGYGKIVNIASVGGGVTHFPGFELADGMSKAALAYLTKHVAAECVHTEVDVFAVCPGAVETAMFEASTLEPLTPVQRAELLARLPRGRLIQPEEIADLVWWLCSERAGVLHGAVIDASMGLGVHPGLLSTGGNVDGGTG